MNVPPGT